jgi:hypothetical protein
LGGTGFAISAGYIFWGIATLCNISRQYFLDRVEVAKEHLLICASVQL